MGVPGGAGGCRPCDPMVLGLLCPRSRYSRHQVSFDALYGVPILPIQGGVLRLKSHANEGPIKTELSFLWPPPAKLAAHPRSAQYVGGRMGARI
jgi:hypothetical protein